MPDMSNLKQKALEIIKIRGPVLPVEVSKELESNTLFIGAVFSELIADKKIKISHAKVGGSPLYYVDGQEAKLDKLYGYLPGKEKEAYDLLKKNRVLADLNQEAAIRVALRNLRDFSVPIEREGYLFWRWYLVNDSEAHLLLNYILEKIKPKEEPKIEAKKIIKPAEEKLKLIIKEKTDNFLEKIRGYLSNKEIRVMQENIIRKNSEIEMRIKVPSNFGELEFFLKAKNKRRISDSDLILAHHRGQKNKVPTLFLSNGLLTKKAEKYIADNLKGYLIFRKLEE